MPVYLPLAILRSHWTSDREPPLIYVIDLDRPCFYNYVNNLTCTTFSKTLFFTNCDF